MTPLLPTRRKAVELADVLDGRRPAGDAEVRELAAVAEAVRAMPSVQPDADFSAALRARLVATAQRELVPVQRGGSARRPVGAPVTPLRRRVGMAAAAGTFIAVGGGAGMVSASASAIPGELLYPVKRGVERVDLALAGDAAAEGRTQMDLAATRLAEVDALLQSDDPVATERIVDTLEDFTESASAGGSNLVSSYEATGDDADMAVLHGSAVEFDSMLTDLGTVLPVEAADAFAAAAAAVSTLDQQAGELCPDCIAGSEPVAVPTDLVAAAWQTIISPADGNGLISVGGATGGADQPTQSPVGVQLPAVDADQLGGATGDQPQDDGSDTGSAAGPGSGTEVEVDPDDPAGPVDDGTGTVEDTVSGAVDDLLGGGGSSGGGVGDVVDDVDDAVDNTVDEVEGTVGDTVDDTVGEVPVTPPSINLPGVLGD